MKLLRGRVVRGRGLGRRLGFPTANLRLPPGARPPRGVWLVEVRGRGLSPRPGLCNIGVRPTLGGGPLCAEVHLPGFSGDLRRRLLEVSLRRRLRGERRFPSLEALRAQISRDLRAAAKLTRAAAAR